MDALYLSLNGSSQSKAVLDTLLGSQLRHQFFSVVVTHEFEVGDVVFLGLLKV